jgi:hypothetical protein
LSNLSPADRRAYLIANNRLAELSGWDRDLLASELQGLLELQFDDIELTGFALGEIEQPPAVLLRSGCWRSRPASSAPPRPKAPSRRRPSAPHQRLAVDAVRLGSFLPPRSGDRGRVDHMAFDPFLLQGAVDPEPIETRLLEDDSPIAVARPRPIPNFRDLGAPGMPAPSRV